MQEMKAISIWQPYPELIITGYKKYETRYWATKYRGQIALHAAMKSAADLRKLAPEQMAYIEQKILVEKLDDLSRGCVVATGELIACHLITPAFIADLSEQEKRLGDFRPGRYAWEITGIIAIAPVPARGAQRLWTWKGVA